MFKTIRRLINWTGERKKRLYIGFFYSFLQTMFTSMPIMGAAYAINLVLDDIQGKEHLNITQIVCVTGFMIAAVLGRFWFSYLRAKSQESVGYEVTADERIRIGDKLKRVSLGFFDRNKTGDLTAAVTTDLAFFEMYAMKMVDVVVNGYICVFVMALCMGVYNIWVGMIAIVGVLISGVFLHLLGKKSNENAPVHQMAQDQMINATIEYLRGMPIVKAFKQQGVSIEGIKEAYRSSRDINIKIEKNYVPYNTLHMLALKGASVALIMFSSYLALQKTMEIPIMIMILIFSFVMFGSAEAINNAMHVLNIMDTTMDKLEGIENVDCIDEKGSDILLDSYDIEFKNVTFAYNTQSVLTNVSCHIPQNTTTAIVGPSGSGKSTICSLLARFYDVNKGSIKVGGVDVREFTCDSLLKNISMVFQKVYLFRDTIRNNIRFGNPSATEEQIIEVAKKACCHEFIMSLPKGYDAVIGDGGATLSGGEKQRISIARAMLKDAPIVILDEATASVDPENEHLIQQAISALTHGKTIIIIAHRLATIENANQILVVDQGKIVQKGTHKALIGEKGVYKRFVDIREKAEGWTIS